MTSHMLLYDDVEQYPWLPKLKRFMLEAAKADSPLFCICLGAQLLADALGGALGTVAVITRHEVVFFIMGGIFVLETVSVILQVASFKLTGKRIFRMAPIHHHFELKGWPEPRVIVRFWIITVMLVLFGLATLKLR